MGNRGEGVTVVGQEPAGGYTSLCGLTLRLIALPICTDSSSAPRPPESYRPSLLFGHGCSDRRFGRGFSVPEALFVAVLVGTEVVRVVGLLAIAVVVAILTIVLLPVLQALLKVRSVPNFNVVAFSVLV